MVKIKAGVKGQLWGKQGAPAAATFLPIDSVTLSPSKRGALR